MSESRVFSLNGMDVGAVVSRVEGFFVLKRVWRFKALKQLTDM